MDFKNLPFFEGHSHTEGSNFRLLDSINKTEDLIQSAYDKGLKGIAITDHACLSMHVKAIKKFKQMKKKYHTDEKPFDFKLALGDEIYLMDERLKGKGVVYFHFLLIAKDYKGWEGLKEIDSLSWSQAYTSRFMERVVTTKEELSEIMERYKGHIIATTACLGSEFATSVLQHLQSRMDEDKKKVLSFLEWAVATFGIENFFIELQPSESAEQIAFNKQAIKISKATKIRYTIANDIHYINQEDRAIHGAYLNAKKGERELGDFYESTWMKDSQQIYDRMTSYMSDEEILEGINNTMLIYNMVEYYDLYKKTEVPSVFEEKALPQHLFKSWYTKYPSIEYFAHSPYNEDLKLLEQLEKGFIAENYDLKDEEKISRLDIELQQFKEISEVLETRLSGYYTLVQYLIDIIWDDDLGNSIVPAGRGSSTAYLLNRILEITQVNPIDYNLPWWRHVHGSKPELSDIDIDTEKAKRQGIFSAFKLKVGLDRVLNIATFKTEGSKSALLTSCRGLNIPLEEAQEMADMIPFERGSNWSLTDCLYGNEELQRQPQKELIVKITSHPNLLDTAIKIEGIINGRSIHASGVYIFPDHYLKYNSLMKAPNGKFITAFNMNDSDYMGGLKLDVLTTEASDKIRKTMDLLVADGKMEWQGSLRATYNKYLHPDVLDYTTEEMWQNLDTNNVMDLFQFNTDIGQQAISLVKPRSVEEMSTANALMRLETKGSDINPIQRYADFKEDINKWYIEMKSQGLNETEIKILEKYLLSTYGVCGEQEDLMVLSMAEEISGFSIPQANAFKSGVAKKKKEKIVEAELLFYEKGLEIGNRRQLLDYVWNYCFKPQFGYAFSKCHDVPYSLVALQELNLYYKYGETYWNTACLSVASGMVEDEDDEDSNGSTANYGKIARAIAEMKQRGINVEPPDVTIAIEEFKPLSETKQIVFGLMGVSGVGDELIRTILTQRNTTQFVSLQDFVERVKPSNVQMISLIKAGAFDNLCKITATERSNLIKAYLKTKFSLTEESKEVLNFQNFKTIMALDIIPNSIKPLSTLYRFRSYFTQKQFLCDGKPKRYLLDDSATKYFEDKLKSKLTENVSYFMTDEGVEIVYSKFEKFYEQAIKPLADWMLDKNTVSLYNEKVADAYVEEIYNKYCQGSLAKWEMDSLSYYYTSNEFDIVDKQRYNIEDFGDLEGEPTFEEYYSYKMKKNFKRYQIHKIAGTVLDVNKMKHIVYLLTTDGFVVSVKFYEGAFVFYNKTIKEKDEETEQTTYTEKPWLKRGNKLMVAGFRSGSFFFPRRYQNTIHQHTLVLVEEIQDSGDLVLRFERGEGENGE